MPATIIHRMTFDENSIRDRSRAVFRKILQHSTARMIADQATEYLTSIARAHCETDMTPKRIYYAHATRVGEGLCELGRMFQMPDEAEEVSAICLDLRQLTENMAPTPNLLDQRVAQKALWTL